MDNFDPYAEPKFDFEQTKSPPVQRFQGTPRPQEVESRVEFQDVDSHLTLSYNETLRGITEFIEVAIHTILYVRRVYPPDLFIRRKKYDTPVFQSRHPALNKYISGAVKAIGEELALGHVDKAIVVIKNKEDEPLERFVFTLRSMVEVQGYDRDHSVENAITPALLGQYFRSFMSRLTMLEAQLGVMPTDDLSFTVVLELNDDSQPSASEGKDPPPWVPAVTSHTTSATSDSAETHLVRAVNTGIIDVALVVQESDVKLRLLEQEQENARARQKELEKGKAQASGSEPVPPHTDFDPEVKWPEINQMLVRRRRFDIEKLPHLPMEVWLLILQLATEVPFVFLPRIECPFDLPARPTHKEMTVELSRSLITKRYIVLVCKAWNNIATPLLYSAVLLRSGRGVSAAWNTFRDSAQGNASVQLGHYVKRIDLSMRDSRTHHLSLEQLAERDKIAEILRWLPNLSIFTMNTRMRGGDSTCIAKALADTSANTLQTIEWTGRHTLGHMCLSVASWTKLVSSCPNLKSLDGPGCRIFLTVLHPAAQLSHLSVTHDDTRVENVPPNPPTPLHIRYNSIDWDVTHPNTRAHCLQAISLDIRFRDQSTLHKLLAQCPKLSQLVLRISNWYSLPSDLTLDSSITHLGLFIEQKKPRLSLVLEGLGYLTDWGIPGVKTLRVMSRHPLLEGENLGKTMIQEVLQKTRAAGLVLENWEGKPLN
ncbi:hypothetical protein BDM02DRAFT_3187058 [Thelephora ganbajun]|uniref:Uncharacterized protein n=1 Tax=Thelephora ganbajun TaxID=370292 RepID=A0ACB6ZGP1_THEGA|nr:hypothetical protein BDM02DRAFT_3187058 [Thelephora ganbajun]